eukprot:TRINITY_DN1532_c0_g1_i1.p1 TRINITY_DN1532_c0_g1~~TRINITY_DN1532_c0_g1_i1.p1  ORF type:complete len:161 (-),score=24.65 TRINITY_DN1532_c0_g1_i1:141-623(-)
MEDKLASLEKAVTELSSQLARFHTISTRLRITVRDGNPKFFHLNSEEDFAQTVKRMNAELQTSDYLPYDKYNTPYTCLGDFLPDDTIVLGPKLEPEVFDIYDIDEKLLKHGLTSEEVETFLNSHKGIPVEISRQRVNFVSTRKIKKISSQNQFHPESKCF